ncbi:hypothetical protein [Micromonospora sp. KLBMP9576]|uniref:hypothetical protein n=1 Tax=Micromonospora sp. KLBMP9576 TaxID=3424769 RepID=UPI003D8F8DCF
MTKQRRLSVPITALVAVLATPVASWWLVGDLTDDSIVAGETGVSHVIRPVSLGPVGDPLVGVLACVAVVVGLAWLVRATSKRRLDARWWWVLAPLVAAGVLVGLAGRVLTAGVVDANIGAGLALIVGGPVLLVLLTVAAAAALHLRRSRARHDHSGTA